MSIFISSFLGRELPDELSLRDCGVEYGSTLKLVLAMRGGPINTRRVPLPQPPQSKHHNDNSNDIQNLMMKNKDQILDKIPKNGQVCGQLNFIPIKRF